MFGKWEAQIWDAATWKPVGNTLVHGERLTSAQYEERDRARRTPGSSLVHPDEFENAEFDAKATRVLTTARGESILWDVQTCKPVLPPFRHKHLRVSSAAISPDGRLVATVNGADNSVHLWNAITGDLERSLSNDWPVDFVQFDAEGGSLVASGRSVQLNGDVARIWCVKTGLQRVDLPKYWVGHWNCRPALSDNGLVAVATRGGIDVYRIESGDLVLRDDDVLHLGDEMYSVGISRNGSVVSAQFTGGITVWDVKSGRPLISKLKAFGAGPMVFAPSSAVFIIDSDEDHNGIWDAAAGRQICKFDTITSFYLAAFSPDETQLVISNETATTVVFGRSNKLGPERWSVNRP